MTGQLVSVQSAAATAASGAIGGRDEPQLGRLSVEPLAGHSTDQPRSRGSLDQPTAGLAARSQVPAALLPADDLIERPPAAPLPADALVAEPPVPAPADTPAAEPTAAPLPADALVEQPVAPTVPVAASAWPYPAALIAELQKLTSEPGHAWAQRVLTELGSLRSAASLTSPQAARAMENLRSLQLSVRPMLDSQDPSAHRQQLGRSFYGLQRRLDVWQAVCQAARQPRDERAARASDGAAPPQRVHSIELPREARARREPGRGTAQALGLEPLLAVLEQVEQDGSSSAQRDLARMCDQLRVSALAQESALGDSLNTRYRNANIRLAATQQLINRFMPQLDAVEEPVRDRILGARVLGRSETFTRLTVRLVPDPHRIRFRLEAQGTVASNTASDKGPVTFFSEGESTYLAHKLFLLDPSGLRSRQADALAHSQTRVKGLRSDYDGVLLIGSVVRSIARDQQQQQYQQLLAEIDQRVTQRARYRLDTESQRRLDEAQERLVGKLIEPFRKLQLEPVALETKTTGERVILRCRLAGSHQLAAYTPRPMARANTLASIQLHQSLINNVVQQLALDGCRSDLRLLYRRVLDEVGLPHVEVPTEVPARVTIHFADRDALRVVCDQGRIMLEIRVAELVNRSQKWRNFTVRAHYGAQLQGLEASLVRDGIIELIGERLGLRDQFALRGIFTGVFGRDRVLYLIPPAVAQDPRLAGLQVSHFTVRDGWIGLAIGPATGPTAHVAEKTAMRPAD